MGEQVVVVGVDGSPASYTALRWALAHAARISAQVRAVRCWMPIVASRWEAAVTGEPMPSEAVQETRAARELAQAVAAAMALTCPHYHRARPASPDFNHMVSRLPTAFRRHSHSGP